MANVKSFSVQSPYDQQMEELKRRQRMAELMQQEAMQPLESQVAPGGMVVPTSPVLGLAKLLQSYMSGKQLRDIEKQRGEAEQRAGTEAMDFLRTIRQGEPSKDAALAASLSPTPTESIRVPLSPTERQTRIESAFLGGSPQMKLAAQLASMKPERTLQMDKIDPAKFTPESVAAAFKADDPSLLVPVAPKPADEPSILQEYKYAVSQGFNGSLMDYQTALRRAGATNVTNSLGPTMSGVDEQGNPVFFRPSNQGGTPAIIPGVRPEGKPKPEPTQGEKQDAYNVARIVAGAQRIKEATAKSPSAYKPTIKESMAGVVGGQAAMQSAARQIVAGAQADMLDAMLYLATGATYTKEQMQAARAAYLPGPLDKKEYLESKKAALLDLVKAGKQRAGRGWTPDAERAFKKAFDLPEDNESTAPAWQPSPDLQTLINQYVPPGGR